MIATWAIPWSAGPVTIVATAINWWTRRWEVHGRAKPTNAAINTSKTKAHVQESYIKSNAHAPASPWIITKPKPPGSGPWIINTAIPWSIIKASSIYNNRVALNITSQITTCIANHHILGGTFVHMHKLRTISSTFCRNLFNICRPNI